MNVSVISTVVHHWLVAMYILKGTFLFVAKRERDCIGYMNIGGQRAWNMVTDQMMLQPLIPRTVVTMPVGPVIHRQPQPGHPNTGNIKASNTAYTA